MQHKYDIETMGELGSPLVTACHYNVLWAVALLLSHGADLTKRHIDWPLLTLYHYCIQFSRIEIKAMIDKHIRSLIQQRKSSAIRRLLKDGWTLQQGSGSCKYRSK